MILYAKFALHQPLNRQSEAYAREGVDLPLSTLADDVGVCAAILAPLANLIGAHVFAAARIHGDDTPVPLLAKGKTIQARLWTYVRDDRPFGGSDPPAAVYFFSRDRSGDHPERHLADYGGILQADAYAGFNALYKDDRVLGRSRRRHVGRMQEGSFLSWLISRRRPGLKSPSSFRRSHSKR
jgi:transposase